MNLSKPFFLLKSTLFAVIVFTGCQEGQETKTDDSPSENKDSIPKKEYLSQPLVKHIYTADPSAHVFNDRVYIYPSHDTSTGTKEDDIGSHFDMRDYHILSMDSVGAPVTDQARFEVCITACARIVHRFQVADRKR